MAKGQKTNDIYSYIIGKSGRPSDEDHPQRVTVLHPVFELFGIIKEETADSMRVWSVHEENGKMFRFPKDGSVKFIRTI